jgi:ADP-heptose:LPS heptosyltransferase
MRKVLIVRHGAMGDVLLLYPFLKQLKKETQTEVHLLSNYSILENSNVVDYYLPMSKFKLEKIENNYDKVYFPYYEFDRSLSIYSAYSLTMGFEPIDKKIEINIPKEFSSIKKKYNLNGKILLGIQTNTGNIYKDLPLEKFQILIHKLKEKFSDLEILVFSDKKNDLENCINLSAKIPNLKELIFYISEMNYFIGLDSALSHIARGMNIPNLIIHGPTDPSLIFYSNENTIFLNQINLDCLGCYHKIPKFAESLNTCKIQTHSCMNDLNIDTIIHEFNLLTKNQTTSKIDLKLSIPKINEEEILIYREHYREKILRMQSISIYKIIFSKIKSIILQIQKGEFQTILFKLKRKLF